MKKTNKILSGMIAAALFIAAGSSIVFAEDSAAEWETVETFYASVNSSDGNSSGYTTGYTANRDSQVNTANNYPQSIGERNPVFRIKMNDYNTVAAVNIVKINTTEFISNITADNIADYAIQFDLYIPTTTVPGLSVGLNCSSSNNTNAYNSGNYAINLSDVLGLSSTSANTWTTITVPLSNASFDKRATDLAGFDYSRICGVSFLISNFANQNMYLDNIKIVKKAASEPPAPTPTPVTVSMSALVNSAENNSDGTYNSAFTSDSIELSSFKAIALYDGETCLGGFSIADTFGINPENYSGEVKLGLQINNIDSKYQGISVILTSADIKADKDSETSID